VDEEAALALVPSDRCSVHPHSRGFLFPDPTTAVPVEQGRRNAAQDHYTRWEDEDLSVALASSSAALAMHVACSEKKGGEGRAVVDALVAHISRE